jgi:diguanylate cyclase (GGDEF)-like protein
MKTALRKAQRLLHGLEVQLGRRHAATGCVFVALTALTMTMVLVLTQAVAQISPAIGHYYDSEQLASMQLLSVVMGLFYIGVARHAWRHLRSEEAHLGLAYLLTTGMLVATAYVAILYGIKDTPMSLLLISAVALARAWFPARVLVPGVVLAAVMVIASEVLLQLGLMRYAPLLSAPVVHGDSIAPWWRNWSEGIYNLVALFFSGMMFFIFWLMDRHNEQLEKLARTDALTGLVNRGTFMRLLEAACAQQRAGAATVCVMLCDIDHFHRLNAQHGQPVGDRVLQRVAAFMRELASRPDAVAARFGGGAFALLLPGTSPADAGKLADCLHEFLATQSFESHGQAFAITMSTGIAEDARGDAAALLKMADDNLYAAKLARTKRELAAQMRLAAAG